MKMKEEAVQSMGTRWLEGLILLAVLVALIAFSSQKGPDFSIIQDEPVSAWSGTVDNLK